MTMHEQPANCIYSTHVHFSTSLWRLEIFGIAVVDARISVRVTMIQEEVEEEYFCTPSSGNHP